jgi:hypothetical protein
MPPLLEARNVTKVFGGGLFNRTTTVALDNFSMVIGDDKPSITAVVGGQLVPSAPPGGGGQTAPATRPPKGGG